MVLQFPTESATWVSNLVYYVLAACIFEVDSHIYNKQTHKVDNPLECMDAVWNHHIKLCIITSTLQNQRNAHSRFVFLDYP